MIGRHTILLFVWFGLSCVYSKSTLGQINASPGLGKHETELIVEELAFIENESEFIINQ